MEDAFKTVGLIAGLVGLVALFSHVMTNKPGNPNNMGPYAQGQPMYVGYQCPEIQYQVNPRDPMPFRYNRPRATYGENPIYVRPSTIPNFKFEYEKPRAFREEPAMNTPFTYAKPVEVAQPTQSSAYNPGYAWGNYAYVSAIASTPTTRMPYYTHTAPTWRKPAAVDQYAWGSTGGTCTSSASYAPQRDGFWGWGRSVVDRLRPVFEFISPAQKAAQRAADEAAYNNRFGSSVRTFANGVKTAFSIPNCYSDDGSWRG